MNRILVTGAAGFIGSHVTRRLLAEGHDVVGLDDYSTGLSSNLPRAQECWTFVEGDIRSPEVCADVMDRVDAVVHLAAQNSVPRSLRNPRGAVEVNVTGGTNLLVAAQEAGVGRFIYASSSSVYGGRQLLPTAEDAPLAPCSPYAGSKAAFEGLAASWSSSWGMQTVGLRFFNVFGPHQDPDRPFPAVVPSLAVAALSGRSPVIHGDGRQSRDFTYVDNAVDGVCLALSAELPTPSTVVNVAAGSPVSVLQLWAAIAEATGCIAPPSFTAPRGGGVAHSHADIALAATVLGYTPRVSFNEGIARTMAWFQSTYRGVSRAG